MKQRICPVCGHLESAGTEYCTECNSKTIEYDDGTSEPETEPEEEDAWEESAGRQEAGRKGSGKSGGGSRRVPLGGIGIVAVLVIVALVFVNRNLSDSGEDSGSSGGSGPAQSGSEDEDLSGGAEDGSLPGNGEEPGNGKEPADGQEERYPEESGEGQDGQESDTELSAEGIAVEEGINSYELIVADVTWSQAYYDCLDRGGHLVRITTDAEYQAILQQIASEGKENIIFWLGGARNDDSGYYWIYNDGYFGSEVLNEDAKYASYWLDNEPSFHDDAAGVDETRICMFRLSSSGQWVWNDVPDDILSVASFYSGKIGYICEYE